MKLITTSYQDTPMVFNNQGWFNATQAANHFGKRIDHWLENQETQDYIEALAELSPDSKCGEIPHVENPKETKDLKYPESRVFEPLIEGKADPRPTLNKIKDLVHTRNSGYVRTSKARADRGGGTWLHPKLAVQFARWLDVRFAVWCDQQIDSLLRGKPEDWKRLRHEAASSHKLMCSMLQLTRNDQGKGTASYMYANEARLVNWALGGEFIGLDREVMDEETLNLLAKLEKVNTMMIAKGIDYKARKPALKAVASLPTPHLVQAA